MKIDNKKQIINDLNDSFQPFYREIHEACRSGHNSNGRKNQYNREKLMIHKTDRLKSIANSMMLSMRAHPDHKG